MIIMLNTFPQIQEKIGDVKSTANEDVNSINDDSILDIQNKIDNIIDENDLKEFIDNV